jgi:hypothetical protein
MTPKFPVDPQFVISLAIPPYIVARNLGNSFAQSVISLGLMSEELFRGDRLPLLPFPRSADPESPQPL